MPVSTFSAGSEAVRSSHGPMIERWNSTRDRIARDERRTSNSEITEMDGTGLHERPNWPLADAIFPERSVSPDKDEPRAQEAEVMQDAVIRRSEDVASPGPDGRWRDELGGEDDGHEDGRVSDIEEDVEDDEAVAGAEPTLGPEARTRLQDQIKAPQREAAPSISPNRSSLSGSSRRPSSGKRRVPSIADSASSRSPRAQYAVQHPDQSRILAPEVSPLRIGWPSPTSMDDVSQFGSTNGDHMSQHSPRSRSVRRSSGDGASERDFQAPQSPRTITSQYIAESRRASSSSVLPQRNGTLIVEAQPTANGHERSGSMVKGPLPSRSTSRASMSTTHIPMNKDRVRYSWQSMKDDEPNRPRIHIIKLVSEVATASAGFPGGEAFGFSISPAGRRIAVYNSARLYVLQTAALPVGISQDYALKRRPLAVEIVDEGGSMAILADAHTINIYDLGHQRLRRTKTIKTDFPTNCIALAPTGGLIATAYEGGVEIFSLDPNALPTDRRAVRSQRMDRLAFSADGSTLVGTTTRINVSSTVVVSVPVYPVATNGTPTHQELKEAWCSELLHPENIRNSSHATFLREGQASCNDRLFAWNGAADTFGILNVEDMQYGNIDFPVVISPPLSTCGGLGAAIHSCPAIDEHGDTVAMIVNDRTIRLYIVPPRVGDDETTVEAHSIDHELDEGYGCPFNEVRWVYSTASLPAPISGQAQVKGRLIVTSPGGVVEQGLNGEDMVDDVEGGRIILFDFDPQFSGQPGQTFSLTLGKSPPQMLEEQQVDVADEVALVRRRTVNQSKGGGLSSRPVTLGRAATQFNSGGPRSIRAPSPNFLPRPNRSSMMSLQSLQSEAVRSLPDLAETPENSEGFEEPYAQNAPRSQASLQRAASNAQRHRFQTLEERNQERVSVDSTGNFLPLPEYSEEPNAPLPSRFRAMAGLDAPPQPPPKPSIVTSSGGTTVGGTAATAPATAPAGTAESFNADEAFRTAAATYSGVSQSRQDAVAAAMQAPSTSGFSRSETFNSINSMPRSLQRAYSNAISPLGSGPAPSLIGDWENVSPVTRSGTLINGTFSPASATSRVPENEQWDAISVAPNSTSGNSSPFSRAQQASNPAYRHSTSLFNPPGHGSGAIPNRMPSNASSFNTMNSTTASSSRMGPYSPLGVSTSRRLPPHMQTFRTAAAANASANASASLFLPTHESDHVPLRVPPANAGSVPHPVMAWHPPAASSISGPPGTSPRGGHSRKSSLAGRSAFASTEKARKLGFFKKSKKQPFMPGGYPEDMQGSFNGGGRGNESLMETRSTMTWRTRGEGKCAMM
ncbi:hypothetical protein LTR78_003455 [Recurvomyces mirabilis]|uniref:DUF7165 domain-containing protein n=1 Tax=Recurvomyces mirabilis TaxID=574656 RepID=A0AAE0WRX8_9PEZI|nr:hypothetical protein LTR78_003455 [Recurvomyces mirabilis]KAK5154511.1 hypothetical protein LTS14_006648 [Recurvomyces mirabilis]